MKKSQLPQLDEAMYPKVPLAYKDDAWRNANGSGLRQCPTCKTKGGKSQGGVYTVTDMPHTRENALKHTLKFMFGKLYLWHPCITCKGSGLVKTEDGNGKIEA